MDHRPAAVAGLTLAALCLAAAGLVGCTKSTATQPTTTTASTTTTTAPSETQLSVDGVRPGVLQAPFYPPITVTQVSCGPAPKGGQFVRIDLPAGGPGTPSNSVMSHATALIVVPEAAILIDPRYPQRVLYSEAMASISTTMNDFVLTLANNVGTGANGAVVEVGNVQVSGGFQCPAAQVPYPGT